jgi:ATP-dependent RNA helicase DeaD
MAQGKTPLFVDAGREPEQRIDNRGVDNRRVDSPRHDSPRPEKRMREVEPAREERAPRSDFKPREKLAAKRPDSTVSKIRGTPPRHAVEPEAVAEPAFGKNRPKRDDEDVETFRVEVGTVHGVKPANIVGAIANEAGIEGKYIGRVVIREDHSFVDLPSGMPKEVFRSLQKVRVAGQQLQISRALRTQAEKLRRKKE